MTERAERERASLGDLRSAVDARLRALDADGVVARIWARDHTVWKPDPTEIADRLGWLTLVTDMRAHVEDLRAFAADAATEGFTDAVLLGMGGSSLAPEVMRRTFGIAPGALDLHVLDTTHPAAIAALTARITPERTLFVVASKSGSTVETLSHLAYFWALTGETGQRFVAITDPGTSLEALGRERGFRRVFANPPDIGGRYSALSLFGLVPAALIGAPLDALLDDADAMARACREPRAQDDPGAWLGAVIGEAARAGRDKLTFVLPDPIASFGSWVEQLLAESTGKQGTGILPVVGGGRRAAGPPPGARLPRARLDRYGDDRLFVAIGDAGTGHLDARHPVVRLAGGEPDTLGGAFFRWEFATAVAGAVLGIQPFDQPDVAGAKHATDQILSSGARDAADDGGDLRALLDGLGEGSYVALCAFLEPSASNEERLQRARVALRDRFRVATTVGFGPRYLHSTGQMHKGGPPTGSFIQIVDPARPDDVPIPGAAYTFGELLDAQALGDLRSLRARGRPAVRVTMDELEATLASLG